MPLPSGFVDVSFKREGTRIVDLAVNFTAIIDGIPREVVRWDTNHGHLHKHDWLSGEERLVDLEDPADPSRFYNAALTAAIEDLKKNWAKYVGIMEGKAR